MDNRPIGIFDSGLGGLTSLKELRQLLPQEDLIYFGDTGRVPYGVRSPQTLRRFAMENIRFLQSHDVKMIVAACGTISSIMTDEMAAGLPIPFIGVVKAAALAACRITRSGRIGVIGTPATIRSGSYKRIISETLPQAQVATRACPLFVPLVENGYIEETNPVTEMVARDYLSAFDGQKPDTLILGCTHYPLISPVIGRIMGNGVTLIDAGQEAARQVKEYLSSHELLAGEKEGRTRYFVSADTEDFDVIAARFLGRPLECAVEHVDVDDLCR
ncbi:MAG: glutamate racemase [Oscillospiraceae bacterium]|nr:glutamate racemase [Oscillospiraceae bacterium]